MERRKATRGPNIVEAMGQSRLVRTLNEAVQYDPVLSVWAAGPEALRGARQFVLLEQLYEQEGHCALGLMPSGVLRHRIAHACELMAASTMWFSQGQGTSSSRTQALYGSQVPSAEDYKALTDRFMACAGPAILEASLRGMSFSETVRQALGRESGDGEDVLLGSPHQEKVIIRAVDGSQVEMAVAAGTFEVKIEGEDNAQS